MKISYNWLQNRFFGGALQAPEDVAALITRYAFEVEGMERESAEKGGDVIFDIKVLPNRAHDCLSHEGMAREISVLSGAAISYKPARAQVSNAVSTAAHVSLSIAPDAKCHRAAKRIITGVKVGESPQWLKTYLQAVGQKPINNVVDAANFVMLETGQPVHTFDYDKIAPAGSAQAARDAEKTVAKNVVVRNARAGEKVECLDGKTYTLDETMMVIADDAQALDIAGIKGGALSGVGPETTRVLMSACNFDAVTIRATSKKLGLRTDASARFENEITPEFVPNALELLAGLIQETAGGDVAADTLDVYSHHAPPVVVNVSLAQIASILGISLGEKEVGDLLSRMNFSWKKSGEYFEVTAPASRIDIRITEDVVEEIERLLGYDTLPSLPLSAGNAPVPHKTPFYTEKIRATFIAAGFSEVYTYAFGEKGDREIANPPASDKKFLRSCVLPGIGVALAQNISSADLLGLDRVRVFEMGNIFKKDEEIFALGIGIQSVRKEKDAVLTEEMDRVLHALAEFCPSIQKAAEIFPEKGKITARINLSKVFEESSAPTAYESFTALSSARYKAISPYPYIVRDVAVFVPGSVTADDVLKKILPQAGDLVVNHYLFDRFEKTFPDGVTKVSYGFRLIFQSSERTLTDDEVNKNMEAVTVALNSTLGWSVR